MFGQTTVCSVTDDDNEDNEDDDREVASLTETWSFTIPYTRA